jgi:hypothetical protein
VIYSHFSHILCMRYESFCSVYTLTLVVNWRGLTNFVGFHVFNWVHHFFFFWWDLGLNSGLHVCKTDALPGTTPLVHFALVILETGSHELFARTDLNCDPPNLSLPNRKDYRHEPQESYFIKNFK